MKVLSVKTTNTWANISIKKSNFEVHISKNTRKLARQSGILYKSGKTLNKSQLVQHIRSLISPTNRYGVLLYGLNPKP